MEIQRLKDIWQLVTEGKPLSSEVVALLLRDWEMLYNQLGWVDRHDPCPGTKLVFDKLHFKP